MHNQLAVAHRGLAAKQACLLLCNALHVCMSVCACGRAYMLTCMHAWVQACMGVSV